MRALRRDELFPVRRPAVQRRLDAPRRPAVQPVPDVLIRLDGVTKTYRMGASVVTALHDVSLLLPRGQFVGIVGRSGSGKSTLLHLLAGMETPTRGSIVVDGWQLADLTAREQARYRREAVGMIFQQFNLIPTMTALQNVALPLVLAGTDPAEREARAAECLEVVGLGHRTGHRPTQLSGGEQQRVAIARALAADPPLLLCDEPTGNLDSTTGRQIIDLLERVHHDHGRTVVMVTHHPDEIAHVADHLVELHDGRVV